jgi:hypothetical protein
VSNYKSSLNNALSSFPGAPATSGVLQTGTLKNLSDALNTDLSGGTTLPFETVQNIRSAIGEKLSNPQLVPDTSHAALKNIYRGLTGDLTAGAATVSPEASAALTAANDATRQRNNFIEQHLGPILNAATPEQAAAYALQQAQKGSTRLDALTTAMPGVTGDLGSYTLRKMAGNPDSPSPTAFFNGMNGRRPLLSPQAQDVLFPNQSPYGYVAKQDIADLSTTANKLKDIEHAPPQEGSNGWARIVAGIEGAKVGHEIGGEPGAVIGGGVGLFAPTIAGKAAGFALNPTISSIAGRSALLQPASLPRVMRGAFANTLPQSKPNGVTDNMFDDYAPAPSQ